MSYCVFYCLYKFNVDVIPSVYGKRTNVLRTIENAVEDLCAAFKKGLLLNSFSEDIYFNINIMKNIKAK